MKYFRFLLLSFLCLFLIDCVKPVPKPFEPQTLSNKVVVLVQQAELLPGLRIPGKFISACTGFFVSTTHFMTARHCVANAGQLVQFKLLNDVNALENSLTSSEPRYALIKKVSPTQDLALLSTIGTPAQPYISLANYGPSLGDKVWIMGHGAGLMYTTIQGTVSAFRKKPIDPGLDNIFMYQVQTPLWYGFSGSPVVNADGDLIGVAQAISTKIPDTGLIVSLSEIKQFLDGEELF